MTDVFEHHLTVERLGIHNGIGNAERFKELGLLHLIRGLRIRQFCNGSTEIL